MSGSGRGNRKGMFAASRSSCALRVFFSSTYAMNKTTLLQHLLFLLALLLPEHFYVLADLPLHCLIQDAVGDWTFYVEDGLLPDEEDEESLSRWFTYADEETEEADDAATSVEAESTDLRDLNLLYPIPTCGHTFPNSAAVMAQLDQRKVVAERVALLTTPEGELVEVTDDKALIRPDELMSPLTRTGGPGGGGGRTSKSYYRPRRKKRKRIAPTWWRGLNASRENITAFLQEGGGAGVDDDLLLPGTSSAALYSAGGQQHSSVSSDSDVVRIPTPQYKPYKEISVKLTDEVMSENMGLRALVDNEEAVWTMVADEGVHIRLQDKEFFAHFDFRLVNKYPDFQDGTVKRYPNMENIVGFQGIVNGTGRRLPPKGQDYLCKCDVLSAGWTSVTEIDVTKLKKPNKNPFVYRRPAEGGSGAGGGGASSTEAAGGAAANPAEEIQAAREQEEKLDEEDEEQAKSTRYGCFWGHKQGKDVSEGLEKILPMNVSLAHLQNAKFIHRRKTKVVDQSREVVKKGGYRLYVEKIPKQFNNSAQAIPELTTHIAQHGTRGVLNAEYTDWLTASFLQKDHDHSSTILSRTRDVVNKQQPLLHPISYYLEKRETNEKSRQRLRRIISKKVSKKKKRASEQGAARQNLRDGGWKMLPTAELPNSDAFPVNFTWRGHESLSASLPEELDILSEDFDQGACGSCYVHSATNVMQMRTRIAFQRRYNVSYPLTLSWRAAMRCNPYNEGCGGGFPYLVFKQFAETGVPAIEKANAGCDPIRYQRMVFVRHFPHIVKVPNAAKILRYMLQFGAKLGDDVIVKILLLNWVQYENQKWWVYGTGGNLNLDGKVSEADTKEFDAKYNETAVEFSTRARKEINDIVQNIALGPMRNGGVGTASKDVYYADEKLREKRAEAEAAAVEYKQKAASLLQNFIALGKDRRVLGRNIKEDKSSRLVSGALTPAQPLLSAPLGGVVSGVAVAAVVADSRKHEEPSVLHQQKPRANNPSAKRFTHTAWAEVLRKLESLEEKVGTKLDAGTNKNADATAAAAAAAAATTAQDKFASAAEKLHYKIDNHQNLQNDLQKLSLFQEPGYDAWMGMFSNKWKNEIPHNRTRAVLLNVENTVRQILAQPDSLSGEALGNKPCDLRRCFGMRMPTRRDYQEIFHETYEPFLMHKRSKILDRSRYGRSLKHFFVQRIKAEKAAKEKKHGVDSTSTTTKKKEKKMDKVRDIIFHRRDVVHHQALEQKKVKGLQNNRLLEEQVDKRKSTAKGGAKRKKSTTTLKMVMELDDAEKGATKNNKELQKTRTEGANSDSALSAAHLSQILTNLPDHEGAVADVVDGPRTSADPDLHEEIPAETIISDHQRRASPGDVLGTFLQLQVQQTDSSASASARTEISEGATSRSLTTLTQPRTPPPPTSEDDYNQVQAMHKLLVFAKYWGYVGGYAQGAEEDLIMRHIYKDGPVTMSLNPDGVKHFGYLHKMEAQRRVLDASNPFLSRLAEMQEPLPSNEKIVQPWSQSTHSIICVGWGVQQKVVDYREVVRDAKRKKKNKHSKDLENGVTTPAPPSEQSDFPILKGEEDGKNNAAVDYRYGEKEMESLRKEKKGPSAALEAAPTMLVEQSRRSDAEVVERKAKQEQEARRPIKQHWRRSGHQRGQQHEIRIFTRGRHGQNENDALHDEEHDPDEIHPSLAVLLFQMQKRAWKRSTRVGQNLLHREDPTDPGFSDAQGEVEDGAGEQAGEEESSAPASDSRVDLDGSADENDVEDADDSENDDVEDADDSEKKSEDQDFSGDDSEDSFFPDEILGEDAIVPSEIGDGETSTTDDEQNKDEDTTPAIDLLAKERNKLKNVVGSMAEDEEKQEERTTKNVYSQHAGTSSKKKMKRRKTTSMSRSKNKKRKAKRKSTSGWHYIDGENKSSSNPEGTASSKRKKPKHKEHFKTARTVEVSAVNRAQMGEKVEQKKFWEVRNSWGREWGDRGYAKLERGINMAFSEIESEYVVPDMEKLHKNFVDKNPEMLKYIEEANKLQNEQRQKELELEKQKEEAAKQSTYLPNITVPVPEIPEFPHLGFSVFSQEDHLAGMPLIDEVVRNVNYTHIPGILLSESRVATAPTKTSVVEPVVQQLNFSTSTAPPPPANHHERATAGHRGDFV
ncbi:unnamed protein product [Amoebophrya sp. A120]|nr:unnamed protein product [Amoebophrya sp. A120]|eukprot:GSA120T00022595001.1